MSAKQVVALSVDKVQTFLTETIHAHVQEKQTEQATLKNIMRASSEISEDFHKTVMKMFPEKTDILLACSGVLIFLCELPESEIESRLNQLFLQYYDQSQGQKLLKCVSFPQNEMSKIELIKEAKKELKQSQHLSMRYEKNKDVLFSFREVKFEDATPKKAYPFFAKDINALFSEEEANNENCFWIAVIKADLDGMGQMFQDLSDYDVYRGISGVLNHMVSLDGLYRFLDKEDAPLKGKLFPFYVAGDDIFFAVSVANLCEGIELCRKMLNEINTALKKAGAPDPLRMSIGVEITYNREPIRYYMEMVEKQLRNAKKTGVPEELNTFPRAKISIYNFTFFDFDGSALENHKKYPALPIWSLFLKDVNNLIFLRNNKNYDVLGTHGFFYTLLERLTESSSDHEFINNVLYSLFPNYLQSPDETLWKAELLRNAGVLRQLLCEGEKDTQTVINKNTKHRLETYIRLMLFFTDDRFQKTKGSESSLKIEDEEVEEAENDLFSKPVDYLYQVLGGINENLRNTFIRQVTSQDSKKPQYYRRLKIEKSMFFKLRKIKIDNSKEDNIQKVINMILLQNSENNLKTKKKRGKKAPYRLYFDPEKLRRSAFALSAMFVDSLMLAYGYIDASIDLISKKDKIKNK